ncbi:MAG: hypothetical protein KDC15_03430 [Chitinophagaceae bacterium]|nr:hypothetical protein [Chitinophagaceae bacterium]
MKKRLSGIMFFFFTVTILLLTVPGCSKKAIEEVQATYLQQQFEANILNKNFRVHLATDNGVDLTSQYTGYTYVLYKSTYYNGPMTAVKNGVTYNGTWSCNDDYSKLSINFPSAPPEFVFLNRDWRFTKKSLPIMELAPWGTTDPKVLHMEQF